MAGFHPTSGFSLLELAVVVLILLVVGTISIPTMVTIISNARLRGGATNLSGLLQNCRMLAVKENKTKTTWIDETYDGPIAYVKNAGDTTPMAAADPKASLGTPLKKYTTPTGFGAPPQISSTQLGFTASLEKASFNSRGIPCEYEYPNCTNSGFIYYFKDKRPFGKSGWTAVSISPAGRIKRWFWNGTAWGD